MITKNPFPALQRDLPNEPRLGHLLRARQPQSDRHGQTELRLAARAQEPSQQEEVSADGALLSGDDEILNRSVDDDDVV